MGALDRIDLNRVPEHVAIIMDGNGRWAQNQGQARTFGHLQGVEPVRDTLEGAIDIGIKYITLFAFSTENWVRPSEEVKVLMEILVNSLHGEIGRMMENGIRLHAFGQLDYLPEVCQNNLWEAMDKTKGNARLQLNLALSYGSRWELVETIKAIVKKSESGEIHSENIDEKLVSSLLCTKGIPDPDLLIRTSGEHRVSNFLLWQIAYTEFYFIDKFWPEFTREDLFEAVHNFQNRERRFGATSPQVPPPQDLRTSDFAGSSNHKFKKIIPHG
jgi:undecaprenyl diphosphate synthase